MRDCRQVPELCAAVFAFLLAAPGMLTAAPPPPIPAHCQDVLDHFCNNQSNCALETKKGDASGNHCAHGQRMVALQDIGYGVQSQQMVWRCYAANSTNANHTGYRQGGRHCYCSRGPELSALLCSCDPSRCHAPPPPLPPPPPPPPLPQGAQILFGFEQSRENSNASRYDDFTVPALVRSPVTGELLAIVEGQAYGCHPSAHGGHGDEGDTDLIQRRSTDSVYKLVNRAS